MLRAIEPDARAEWKRGWKIILAAAIGAATGISMFNITAGLFIQPIQEELGWSRSAVTITTIIFVCTAVGSIPSGYLIDRFGSRNTALFGLVAFALALLAYAVVPINAYSFYGIALFIGLISPLIGFGPFSKGVASWFRKGFGGALGLTLSGPSMISLLAIPIVTAAIYNFGWRAGYLTLAGFTLFVGIPITLLVFRDRPREPASAAEAQTVLDGATWGEALRDWRYWGLLLLISICALAYGGYMVHLIPILSSRSIELTIAVGMGVLYAMSASVGRIGGGFLLDRFEPHVVMALFFLFAGLGSILIAYVPVAVIGIPVVAIALGTGAEGDCLAYFTQKYFGTRAYGLILGSLTVAGTLGIGIGAFLYSSIFDQTQSYVYACLMGGACFFSGGAIMAVMGILQRGR